MNKLHHIRSTSKQSAIAEPIILRKGEKSRLVFKPEIVDNKKNPSACVKGTFIFQVKGIKEEWSDYKTLDLTRLRKGEWVKLQLKSGELLTLITALDDFYNIYEKYGIVRGEKDVIITDANIKTVVVEMLSSDVNLKRVFAEGGPELIIKTIEWLGNSDDSKEIIEKLKKLEISTIARVNSILGLSSSRKCSKYGMAIKQTLMRNFGNNCLRQMRGRFHKCFRFRWSFLRTKHTWGERRFQIEAAIS